MGRSFRTSRSRFRRRRSPYDLQSTVYCRLGLALFGPSTCAAPNAYATMIAGPFNTLYNANVVTPGAAIGAKGWTWGGMHFQSEFSINPAGPWSAGWLNIVDVIEIYEAIVVLPLAQGGFTTPAYIPSFTNVAGGFQTSDAGDRVLWKRISLNPFWGAGVIPTSQLQMTARDEGHGPVLIRTKARLNERQGIFHVVNIVHGNATEGASGTIGWSMWARQAIKMNMR